MTIYSLLLLAACIFTINSLETTQIVSTESDKSENLHYSASQNDDWEPDNDDDDMEDGTDLSDEQLTAFLSSSASCTPKLGAPYLYVTFHTGDKIYKFSRDGCFIDDKVLLPNEDKLYTRKSMFRSLVVGPYQSTPHALYVVNSKSKQPQLMVFGQCDLVSGKRSLLDAVVAAKATAHVKEIYKNMTMNSGANHGFGIALDVEENGNVNVFTTYQHTDVVMQFGFFEGNLKPSNIPEALLFGKGSLRPYYPGTFHQFGAVGAHPGGDDVKVSNEEQGVRGVAVVGQNVWIANENLKGVLVVDKKTGIMQQFIPILNPIGLFYYEYGEGADDRVYVSSKKRGNRGSIMAIDITTYTVVQSYRFEGLEHPAGIAVYDSIIYFTEQVLGTIYKFHAVTGTFLGQLIPINEMGKRVESVTLSPC